MAGPRASTLPVRSGLAGLALACAAALALAPACARKGPEQLVLIVIDTLRRDHLSCYGGLTPTPEIDALAARGQSFPELLASFHQTSMSMAALFTGRTPSIESGLPSRTLPWNGSTWCGLSRFAGGASAEPCIPRSLQTLGQRMRRAGYWTIGVVSNEFLFEPSGFSRGFEDWTELGGAASAAQGGAEGERRPRAARYWPAVHRALRAALARRPNDRVFLYVHYIDVHDHRFRQVSYGEAVAEMDGAIGRLFAMLDGEGLLEDAVVVLTSDHGEGLGEQHGMRDQPLANFGHFGNPAFDEELRLPLIVAPALFDDTSRWLRTQDLYYLLQEIAGPPAGGVAELEPGELFLGERFFRTYRSGSWKSTMRREDGLFYLYDLAADPGETRNAADAHPERARAHRRRMDEFSRALRGGPVRQKQISEEDRERLRMLGYLQ